MKRKIVLEHVSVKRGKTDILKDINLVIHEGERVAIIGPNGAGKTTLMMTMIGEVTPSRGKVQNDFNAISAHKRGIILQEMKVNELMTVKETLSLFNFSGADSRAEITRYNLQPNLRKKVSSLSGGEKQKVMLAATFQNDPEIFFIDEITTGLDVSNRLQTMQYLTNYTKDHRSTVVYITHYFEEIEDLVNRIIILNEGTIQEDLPLIELFKKYNVSKKIVIHLNAGCSEQAAQLLGGYSLQTDSDTQLIVAYTGEAELIEIINILHQNNALYREYMFINPTITEVYNEVIKGVEEK